MQYKTDPKLRQNVEHRRKEAERAAEKRKILEEELKHTEEFLNGKRIEEKELKELQLMNYRYLLKDKKEELREY